MHFCDRDRVSQALAGKSVAIVGSGPGSLKNEAGLVDSHEVVLRVNNFKLFGGTGFRTDVHYSFYGSSIKMKVAELAGVTLCMCKCPNAKFMDSAWHRQHGKENGVDFRYIYKSRADWWFCPTYVPTLEEFLMQFNLLGGHVPTTGFAALLDVLSYGPREVFLTGFDFFASGVHNVNEPWRQKNTDDPIGHVPHVERAWIADNIDRLPIRPDATLAALLGRNA